MRAIERNTRKVISLFSKVLTAGIIAFGTLFALALFLMFFPSSLSDYMYEHEESSRLLLLLLDISKWAVLASFAVLTTAVAVLLACWFTRQSPNT